MTYRIIKVRDPRTPGFFWYEIEAREIATGRTFTVAVCDTRDEARDLRRSMEQGRGAVP